MLATRTLKYIKSLPKGKLQIKYVKPRKTKLGDCRYNLKSKTCVITLNNNIKDTKLLLVYLHELAHFVCFEKYLGQVSPHGKEWKYIFSKLIQLQLNEFTYSTSDEQMLCEQIKKPSACFHEKQNKIALLHGFSYANDINPVNTTFVYKGKEFKSIKKLRKRILCLRLDNNKEYSFHPNCIVQLN